MLNDKNLKLTFRCLNYEDIDGCAELIGNVFVNFNSFTNDMEYSPEELKQTAKQGLMDILEDNLTIVALDENSKIVGCYAGVKLTKINALKTVYFKARDELTFNIDLKKMSTLDKNSVLSELEFIFLKEYYDKLILKNEEKFAVYGRYFCVKEEYFGTTLAKDLAFKFFLNCVEKGLKHCYGIVFNYKVFQLLTKYFKGEILKEFKVTFVKGNEKNEFEAFLFYGSADSIKDFLHSKF
jgi:hypothetical protein